jgi:putative colanic acid biosynthesis glycosyltransferase
MEKIKFSVISICFNNLSGLRETYASLREQSYKNFEWIVIDGASNDGTPEWIKTLTDTFIRWSSEPDQGIFDAMNKGIEKSQGDFMVFMNSGDSFANSEVLQMVLNEIEKSTTEIALVYGDSLDYTKTGETHYRKARNVGFYTKGMFTQHQSMYFNRKLLGALKYNLNFPITADYAFIGSFIMKNSNNGIIYINKPLCKFLLGGTNEKKRFKGLKEDYLIRTKIFKISAITALSLLLLHFVHTISKRILPSFVKRIRYD